MNTNENVRILEKYEASAVSFLENIVWEKADAYSVTDLDGKSETVEATQLSKLFRNIICFWIIIYD